MTSIRYERVPVKDLTAYPGNARRGNIETIKESLEAHGQYRPLVVQESSGRVLAGNHTLLAAIDLGWDSVDVGIVDVDDEQARRIVLVDNRTNDLAGYDDKALADLLSEVDDLTGTGFTKDEFDALLMSVSSGFGPGADPDRVVDLPEDPITKSGDTWQLGDHTLHCGDCLELAATLIERADCVWTDPPYLVNLSASTSNHRTDGKSIINDDLIGDEALAALAGWMVAIHSVLRPGGIYFIFMPPGPGQANFINAAIDAGLAPRQVLQWIKDKFVFGRSDWHYCSEPTLYGWRTGRAHKWHGARNLSNVFTIPNPRRSKQHPTMKPIELCEQMLSATTEAGDTVVDLFTGSGTCLVACMSLGRRFIGVELDPAYCDVIVERYERLSGEKAIRLPSS